MQKMFPQGGLLHTSVKPLPAVRGAYQRMTRVCVDSYQINNFVVRLYHRC